MKFRIQDEDGKDYTVEEIEEQKEIETPVEDEAVLLTEEEILALKDLIPMIGQIKELLAVKDEAPEEEKEETVEEDLVEDDVEEEEEIIEEKEETEDDEEEIIETKSYDSKTSFGSIESNKQRLEDSLCDDISDAWTKRYNGGKI